MYEMMQNVGNIIYLHVQGARKKLNNQFNYDYVKLKIGYFSNRIPVWEGIFILENLT